MFPIPGNYSLAGNYSNEFGLTGYALYNVMTDYISNVPDNDRVRHNLINSLQVKAGKWLNSFPQTIQKKDFSIDAYVEQYKDLMK